MQGKAYRISLLLTALLSCALLCMLLARSFMPQIILPKASIRNFALICLITLALDQQNASYTAWRIGAPIAAADFGLLPWAAGFASSAEIWKNALAGGVVFLLSAQLYASICDRLAVDKAGKCAPPLCALGLFLAMQGFNGFLF